MSVNPVLTNPKILVAKKVGGLTISRWLDKNDTCAWYDAVEEAGEKRILYVHDDPEIRNKNRTRVHGFRTTSDETVELAGVPTKLFVIHGAHRLMMDWETRQQLAGLVGSAALVKEEYELRQVLGYGFKGITFRAQRKGGTRTSYALKLTIAEEYEGRSYLPEVDQMVELAERDRDHFPSIHDCGIWEYLPSCASQRFIFFVEDLFPGKTLAEYLDEKEKKLTVGFLDLFVREMLDALSVLQKVGLMHDDLHAGNILIHESLAGIRPVLIDFGSAKPKGNTKKERDDIRNFASHVATIANAITLNPEARSPSDDAILAASMAMHARISDDDPMRRPEDVHEIKEHFHRNFPKGTFKQRLIRPFDFGNAEEVMDNELLQKLAAQSFPWRDKVESSANLLIIGPRGSGKTTVFRSMSFICLSDAGKIDDALARPYVGLYISCNKEFRLRFSALDRGVLKRREVEVRHYFNLLVLREFVGVLRGCLSAGKLAAGDVEEFHHFLTRQLNFSTTLGAKPRSTLQEADGFLARKIDEARMAIWFDHDCAIRTEQGLVADLAFLLGKQITPFHGKTLYLLVDDYTERKVPKEAQNALNHILFVPNAVYKSKISSEVFGVPPDQTFGTFLDQDRDYKEFNLGTMYYIDLPSPEQRRFLEEIVDKRLEICEFAGRVADIIGESEYPPELGGTLARALKRESEARAEAREKRKDKAPQAAIEREVEAEIEHKRARAYYHGWETICNLCTGDVSNILELLARMYEECSIAKATRTRIKPDHQHDVIEDYALQYIKKIKGIPGYGERLFDIVDAFGNMSARLLREVPWRDRDGRPHPYQVIRIELDEAYVRTEERLLEQNTAWSEKLNDKREEAAWLWRLLQRYCIFVDAEEGRSRRNTLASKVILRRIFCPAFKMSLVNSESFTIDQGRWESFCTDPKRTAERYVSEVLDEARRAQEKSQLRLDLFQKKTGAA